MAVRFITESEVWFEIKTREMSVRVLLMSIDWVYFLLKNNQPVHCAGNNARKKSRGVKVQVE
jgi:hypothetical protein